MRVFDGGNGTAREMKRRLAEKGPLSGLVGELVTVGGKSKIAVRLNMLGCACVDMPIGYVEPTKITNDNTKKI